MSIVALIVAAGRGVRFGADRPKQFALLGNKSLLAHSIEIFERMPEFDQIWLVVPAGFAADLDRYVDVAAYSKIAGRVEGGARRQDSVAAGLARLPAETEIVAIHDAVRPFAAPEAIAEAVERARQMGAAILAAPAVDTPKLCNKKGIIISLDREEVWLAQTPQVFQFDLIRRAYERVLADRVEVTDDAAAVERLGHPVDVVRSPRPNPKITTPEDLRLAEWLLSEGKQI
jgi:2-C-methyl-D-erythritol 4-phosphate cytidylyltransferase